jgi:peptidyl-prolyl cis-trans isomerase A (cyclophilin A)
MNEIKYLLIAAVALVLCFALYSKVMAKDKKTYAVIKTSMGDITCELYPSKAPATVKNFIGLANGNQKWIDPKTFESANKPLYNGVIFHRVIPNFMIQTGDPLGSGMGGPGYKFEDEIDASLTFSKPGILAMANSGPGTNGSQFFITVAPCQWLNGHHTIFGKVVKGYDIAVRISQVATGENDRPLEPIVIKEISII